MIACEAITVASVEKRNQGVVQPVGGELVERMIERGRIGDQQRRLSEIIQHQCGQRHCKPRQADRETPEMSHIGVHRFAAGDGQKRRTEDGEADVEILVDQEFEGIERAERDQHRGRLDDAVNAERGEHDEPAEHDRAEDPADEAGALFLHHEQSDQDGDGDRHHGWRQRRRVHL